MPNIQYPLNPDQIVSKAHEWVQSLPLSLHKVECVVCGVSTKIGDWEVPRCSAHVVGKSSGWLAE